MMDRRFVRELLLPAFLLALPACSESPAPRPGREAGSGDLLLDGLLLEATPGADRPSQGDRAVDGSRPTAPNECATMAPDWVFCSSFEEGDKKIWDDYDGNPDTENQLLADPGAFALAGNHVMRFRVPPGRGGADLVKLLPSQHDKLYARWYTKWEKGYDFKAPNHGSALFAGDRSLMGNSGNRPSGADRFIAGLEPLTDSARMNLYVYYRGMYQDCANPVGSCWGDHFPCMMDEGSNYCDKPEHRETVLPPVMQDDRWYCIEMMLDGGTPVTDPAKADGQLDFWIDGQQIGPFKNLWMRTTSNLKISILWLSLFHHEDHSVAGVLYDNVVVSKSRVGCL